jgi:membrane-associated phospholipid phosphatase
MELHSIINYIGYYAPFILFGISVILLRNMLTYLSLFILGFILNNIVNIALKLFIKEPRPTKDQKAIEIGITNGARIGFDKFGMPSAHAQNCAYCLSYIFFTLHNPFVSLSFIVLTILCSFQRYENNNHTLFQILIGLIVGSIVGYSVYLYGNKVITGNIDAKEDDYAPK